VEVYCVIPLEYDIAINLGAGVLGESIVMVSKVDTYL